MKDSEINIVERSPALSIKNRPAANECLAGIICAKMNSPSFKPAGFMAVGASYDSHQIAIPAKGPNNELVGHRFVPTDPKKLLDSKVSTEFGSQPGWLGTAIPENATVGWVLDNPLDLIALVSLPLPVGHFAVCSLFGAEEAPSGAVWMLERFKEVPLVLVVGKADSPWAPAIANFSPRVYGFEPQFPIRDLIVKRSSGMSDHEVYRHLMETAWRGDKIDAVELKANVIAAKPAKRSSDAELTNFNGTGKFFWPKPILEIVETLFKENNNFPKRAGNKLFDVEKEKVRYLDKTSKLFAYIQERFTTEWKSIGPSKEEFKESLLAKAEKFDVVESKPHFPPIPNVYYTCKDRPSGTGEHLEAFLDFFCPATPIDRQLLIAAIATTFWGGHPGGRPGIQFATQSGTAQGAGKSTAAATIAKLSGGSIDFDQDCKREEITKRLLNGESGCRVVLLDNVKAKIFSSASYESLITSKSISGHEMYSGNASKPNHFTFFITFNSANFSRDMAQRLVSVVLGNATKSADWQSRIDNFLGSYQLNIVDDIKAFFDRPKKKLSQYNRWATWQGEIISRLDDPESIIKVLHNRENANDGDAESANDILDHIRDLLSDYFFQTPFRVHIGFPELAKIVSGAIGSPHTAREAGLLIDRFIGSGLIVNMIRNPSRADSKGFLFWSDDATTTTVSYDLRNRIEIRETDEDNKKEKRRAEARKWTT